MSVNYLINQLLNYGLKNNLIDYIASDTHSFRKNYIGKFIKDYKETLKKYYKQIDSLFGHDPKYNRFHSLSTLG